MYPGGFIVTALAAGAVLGLKDTSSTAMKDAHAWVKVLIARRMAGRTHTELVQARHVKTRGCPSHFSRYSGGRSVRAALQNLSAQLVHVLELDVEAPGGMLPEWAQTPGGFEFLLGRAAVRARERGDRLMLVVDGLDEAEPSEECLPFGLPALLPEGVYIVGTYRTGSSPGRPDTPEIILRISKEDQRNLDDIGEFLAKALDDRVLAAKLAEARISAAEFAGVLAERCDGVWIYLRYVLDELRRGLRRADAVSHLPFGLWNYYADQIRRWQHDPAWDYGLLPLLATLAVAGDPLPGVVLARLAGNLDPVRVRRWCDLTFRPLLTSARSGGRGTPSTYEIYHASFRQVLKALPSESSPGPGKEPQYQLQAVNNELREATITAHNRIADAYLRDFGGLDCGLPVLAADPAAARIDSGYPLRHLSRHLQHAGRSADMHRLLAAEHPVGGQHAVNVWYVAHDHVGDVVGYLDDVERVRADSAAATSQSLTRHQTAPALGIEIRYALMTASITSRTASIPVGFFEPLIRAGVWSAERALDHARRLTDPQRRAEALSTVFTHMPPAQRPKVLAWALAAATAIADEDKRTQVLRGLAPHLAATQQADLWAKAAAAAASILNSRDRVRALDALARQVPPDEYAELLAPPLAAAAKETFSTDRVKALTALASVVPDVQRADVLAQALAAANLTGGSGRCRALLDLAPLLPASDRDEVLARALDAAIAERNEGYRADALVRLGPYLPAELLGHAVAAAAAIPSALDRTWALRKLVCHLPAGERDGAFAQALDAAAAITTAADRVWQLIWLIPDVSAGKRDEVLAQALEAGTAIANDEDRAQALTTLASQLPAVDRDKILAQVGAQILAAVAASNHDAKVRAAKLTELALHVAADGQRDNVLDQALDAAATITNDSDRAEALLRLAPNLRSELLTRALAAASATTSDFEERTEALLKLASQLPADQREAVITYAVAAAAAITSHISRSHVLADLLPHLPSDQREAVLAEALSAAAAITSEDSRVSALIRLVPYLPADQQEGVLARALDAAKAITPLLFRAAVLTSLAPRLPAKLLARALDVVAAIPDDLYRAQALTGLACHLPADLTADHQAGLLAQALDTASALKSGEARARILSDLAPHLPVSQQPTVLAQAVADTAMISLEDSHVNALVRLASNLPANLPDDLRAGVLAQIVTATQAITDLGWRAHALIRLMEYLPASLQAGALAQALDAAAAAPSASQLAHLLPYLPADQREGVLAQALDAATAITSGDTRGRVLSELAPYLPADQREGALAQALAAADAMQPFSRGAYVLGCVAPHLPADQRASVLAQAVTVTATIDDPTIRGISLKYLAPHLGGQSDEVLAAAIAIAALSDERYRVDILRELAPHLPSVLLADALAATPKWAAAGVIVRILEENRSFSPSERRDTFVKLLRESLHGANRRDGIRIMAALAAEISKAGGTNAMEECVQTITDIYRWWP